MGIITITCPNCDSVINVPNPTRPAPDCDQCGVSGVPLYTYNANGRSLTLCLSCIQSIAWGLAQQGKVGPGEFKQEVQGGA